MKKIIVLTLGIISSIVLFSACSSSAKCPAYGHYSQVEVTTVDENTL